MTLEIDSGSEATGPRDLLHRVVSLLDSALLQLEPGRPAHDILEATSLLQQQFAARMAVKSPDQRGTLLAWQARKIRDYIDEHITSRVLVADLSTLIERSEAHFSRAFRRTFGASPHAYVIRRRLQLAIRYMLQSDKPLSEIATFCGFVDQAHLCKHFRQTMGSTPAAWRRAHQTEATIGPLGGWRSERRSTERGAWHGTAAGSDARHSPAGRVEDA
jgi:AraC family transcriptional regulator